MSPKNGSAVLFFLSRFSPHSRFGEKLLGIIVDLSPTNGSAVLNFPSRFSPHSRFGEKFLGITVDLSPKNRECGSKFSESIFFALPFRGEISGNYS